MQLFPNYLFLFENPYLDEGSFSDDEINLSNKLLDNLLFVVNHKDFIKDFNLNATKKEKIDLLGYLYVTITPIIFSKLKSIDLSYNSNFLDSEDLRLKELLNIRIDLEKIENKLLELNTNKYVVEVDILKILTEIIVYVFRISFVLLTQNIIIDVYDFKDIDGKISTKKYDYKAELKKFKNNFQKDTPNNPDNKILIANHIKSFLFSFETNPDLNRLNYNKEENKTLFSNGEEDYILKKEKIDFLSNYFEIRQQKMKILEIFISNIHFKDGTSISKQNELLSYFFDNVVFEFFIQGYNKRNSDGGYDNVRAISKYRKRFN